jgi:hypothetical protein
MFKKTRPVPPTLTASLAKIRDGIAAGLIPIDMAELEAMVDYCEEFAQRKVDEGDGSMPKHYMACLSMYSMEFYAERSLYSVVNEHLRAKDRKKVEPISDYVWLLMHAMSLCPPFVERVVFRGVKDLSPDAYKEGDIITWCQFSSTAATVKVQNTFLGQTGVRTLFMIELTTNRAREIHIYSDYPDEKEVLLPPNSRFVVVSVYAPGGGLVNVHLREVAPTDPILVFGSLDAATAVIKGTGGLRKIRYGDERRGKGKRGGLRVIYFWKDANDQFWLFTVYDKDQADDLTASERRLLKQRLELEIKARSTEK